MSRQQPGTNGALQRMHRHRPLLLPGAAALVLGILAFLPPHDPSLRRSYIAAAGVLLLATGVLALALQRSGRTVTVHVVPRKPHYVQMCVQGALFAYWGWHVSFVYELAPTVLAQLIFAYGVSMVLAWIQRDVYELGFGPFPVVFSINFFLIFKPEWFHWQFALVALGFAVKEFVRWDREGRRAHIFNPSSFPLAVFSIVLLLTGSTDVTLGVEIAATLFNPPHMYLVIFLVSLAPQILFGVTTMTMAAVFTTYAFGLVYFAATGTYFFIDAYIPIAVFLGMHLLFTDPATAPRTAAGRILFGILYGCGTMALYAVLRGAGAPAFYDKLLPIPILNSMVLIIDRAAAAGKLRLLDVSRLGVGLLGARRRLATVGVWIVAFVSMSAVGGVGDNHPGQFLPFWEEACRSGSERACEYVPVMQANFCEKGSGWACNQLGIHMAVTAQNPPAGARAFTRGCELAFNTACVNAERMRTQEGGSLANGPPLEADLPIILRGSKGPILERDTEVLYALGCRRGWVDMCGARAGDREVPTQRQSPGS